MQTKLEISKVYPVIGPEACGAALATAIAAARAVAIVKYFIVVVLCFAGCRVDLNWQTEKSLMDAASGR